MGKVCSTHRRGKNAYYILVGKPKGKRPFRRHRHRWEDNIRKDLREMVWKVWIDASGSG
jgi:hypothetical protein